MFPEPSVHEGILIGLSLTVVGVRPLLYIRIKNTAICGVYYYLTNMCIAVALLLVFLYISRRYKLHKREYVCHVYRFVEEYFSKTEMSCCSITQLVSKEVQLLVVSYFISYLELYNGDDFYYNFI